MALGTCRPGNAGCQPAADDRAVRRPAPYLLGHTPSNRTWDGTYRRTQVRVNRRDRSCHRQGYAGRRGDTQRPLPTADCRRQRTRPAGSVMRHGEVPPEIVG
jgi:hypothetical protein